MFVRSSMLTIVTSAMLIIGCEQKQQTPAQPSADSTKPATAAKTVTTGDPESTATTESAPVPAAATGHSGEVVELGESTVDGMKIKASRDKGEITPGGDSPIDIWLNGGLGDAAAVRFWIGIEGGKGSVKAKADVEDGHWHTHAEVPKPLPADSKLWVEIEAKDGKKSVTSFDLSGKTAVIESVKP